MRSLRLLLAVACLATTSTSLKFLVYNPIFARSHVNFMGKLSDVLVEAGHDVVMLAPIVDYNSPGVGSDKVQKVIRVPPSPASIEYSEFAADAASTNLWRAKSVTAMFKQVANFMVLWADQCYATLHYPGLMEELRAEEFDAAMSEPMDKCGMAIFHHLGIKNFASTISIASFEGTFDITGLPSFPSYVPGAMMGYGEKMSFLQRVGNTLSLSFSKILMPYLMEPVEQLFFRQFGPDFPGISELMSETSLWFLNGEPLIEFPRPILHKTIDIGGISVSTGHKPLNKTWSDIMDLRPKTVLLSFGTVAKSFLMPDEYKASIRTVFSKFPDVTFIWKYEKPEHKISEGISNIIETTWVPQNDMLYDPRLSLFITHCGQGSTTEATTAGVPLIVIPVLGDQQRNAAVIARIETGVVLVKESLEQPEPLEAALREVLHNGKYMKKAREVGEMIRNRPFSPRETFVRNMEFLARYGPLRMLDHYGKELNFVQYYLIDVFAFIASIAIVFLLLSYKMTKLVVSRCLRLRKVKSE